MNATFFLVQFKSRTALFVLAALCVYRAFAHFSSASGDLGYSGAGHYYSEAFNGFGAGSFVFVPLFGFLLVSGARKLSGNGVVVRHASRTSLALGYLRCSLQTALLYAVALTAAALPFVFADYRPTLDFLPFVLASTALQALFFTLCALVFYLAFVVARMASVAYMALLVYGLWDYMAVNTPGGGVALIGWGRTAVRLPLDWSGIVLGAVFFAVLAGLLFLLLLAVVRRGDFLTKRGI